MPTGRAATRSCPAAGRARCRSVIPAPLDDAAIRRLAVLTLIIIRGGATIQDLAIALDCKPRAVAKDLFHLTDVTADLYQEDCPVGCSSAVCPHARLRLARPAQTASDIMAAAAGAGASGAYSRQDPRGTRSR